MSHDDDCPYCGGELDDAAKERIVQANEDAECVHDESARWGFVFPVSRGTDQLPIQWCSDCGSIRIPPTIPVPTGNGDKDEEGWTWIEPDSDGGEGDEVSS